jgi:hypothetical protein
MRQHRGFDPAAEFAPCRDGLRFFHFTMEIWIMSKHTPGPWEAHNGEVTTPREDGRSYRRIAAVQDYGVGSLKEVDDANARLMAAAPDMLKALRECITDEASVAYKNNDTEKLRRRLRYITKIVIQQIARATGE